MHRDDPLNVGNVDRQAIKIDLGRPVSQGAVALSDDGRRAYVTTDDGTVCAADLETLAVQTVALGGPAVGIGVCVDPVLSDGTSLTGPDVLFTARNDGMLVRLRWQAGALSLDGSPFRGTASERSLDGSTTALFAATPVAWGGLVYTGDRGGRLNTIDWRTATPSLSSTFIAGAGPIETAAMLRIDGMDVRDIFVSAGARVAWHRPAITGDAGFTVLSRALVIDGAPGAATEGALAAYPLRGTRLVGRPADEALTALTGPQTADAALPGQGASLPVRTDLVAAANVVDDVPPALEAVYGHAGTASAPTSGADVRAVGGTGGLAAPLGLAVGPDGELYFGGKFSDATLIDDGTHEGNTVWVLPARPMVNRWGWASLAAGRLYPIAGPGARGGASDATPTPALREPHGVWHDDRGTADRADDVLWFTEWRGNAVRRVEPDGTVTRVAGVGGGGSTTHAAGDSWAAGTALGRPHAVCVARGGADPGGVYVAEADHDHLLRIDPVTGRSAVAVTLPAPATGVWHDPTTDAVYIASRAGHRVWRYSLATQTLTAIAGTGAPGHDAEGAIATAARLDGPEAICVHPTTGDVYVGEALGDGASGLAGFRVKRVEASTGRLYTIAGDGGLTLTADGRPAPATGLGRVAGLAWGPADLADAAADPLGALYLTARDAHAIARLRYSAPAVPGTATFAAVGAGGREALGLLQWRLGDAFVGRTFLEATIRLVARAAPPGDPARPELLLADGDPGDGSPGPWTAGGLRPDTLPTRDASLRGVFGEGAGPTDRQAWEAGRRYGWTLPAERLPTTGTLAFALQAPADTRTHHLGPEGLPPSGSGVAAITFYGSATGGAATEERAPWLDAFVSDFSLAGGLASPPSLGAGSTDVYAVNANALFKLDASDPVAFTADARYAATRLGRQANGSLDVSTSPARFVLNPTAPFVTVSNKVFALELRRSGATWDFGVNRFNGSAQAGSMLTNSLAIDGKTAPDQTYRAGTFVTSDGFGNDFGFLYFGLGDGRVYRTGL